MPQMTSTIDYKALAERVAQRAIYADNNADPNNKAWAADLRAVVSLLNGMADAQPVAWRCEVRDLLTQAEQCLSTAVRFEQWAHDEPPSYLSAWDYEADHIAAEIRAMLSAAPAAPQAEPTRDWSAIDAAIREYLDGYEQIGENDAGADACYTPTERELYLIYDAINGLFADESFVAAISAPQAEPKREPLSDERIAEIQRAAYERAAQECIETAAELRRCADGCTDGRYDWKADGAADCADAIRALGRQ